MCGFAGILNNAFTIYPAQLAEISRPVCFRGPDSSGMRLYDEGLRSAPEGNNAVFFNRLAIIDLDARSDQPFEDERYTLVFNGEIYNYLPLKKELQERGVVFRTSSDTEVLFHALRLWGAEALGRLNGMFAFSWIDRERKVFLLARDRVGIKPLCYRQQGRSLVFGSELASVLRLSSGERPALEPAAIRQFLWMQFIPTPYTIVQGVFILPPGHLLSGSWEQLERGEALSPRVYWDAYAQAIGGGTVLGGAGISGRAEAGGMSGAGGDGAVGAGGRGADGADGAGGVRGVDATAGISGGVDASGVSSGREGDGGAGGVRVSALENILVDTLSRQMIADVPLGLFLSSGVDSSLLAALVNKHFTGSRGFNFFTVAFQESTSSDESGDALDFIKGFNNPGLHSHTLTIDASLIGERLDRLYDYFDQPFGDQTSLLNWVISDKAKEFVTVALSGDGADELFWGYRRYDQWKNPALQLPRNQAMGRGLASFLKPLLPGGYWRSKAELELEPDPVKRHFSLFLSPALASLRERPIWEEPIWAMGGIDAVRGREDLAALLDIKTYLADAMLYKVDRASMAASLEVRVPYLDNTVVDYALALPFSAKSNETFGHKALLKQLLQELAPHYHINRPKKGFNFPLDRWLRFAWKDRVLSLVNKGSLGELGLEEKWALELVRRYYAGDKRYCLGVWYLFNLLLWHQSYKNIVPLGRGK